MASAQPAIARSHRKKRTTTDEKASPAGVAQSTIVFTGDRHGDNYDVIVKGQRVKLPLACLKVLIGLVIERGRPGHGYVRLNPVTVCRLRRAINGAVGDCMGHLLIETGTSAEYRLGVSADELGSHVAIAPCFCELVQLKIISTDHADQLRDVVK